MASYSMSGSNAWATAVRWLAEPEVWWQTNYM
jgi:hypothetical protein